jgi:LmbE family N-acetylglucosaminyl deacetylase
MVSGERVLFIGSHPDDIDLGCGISMHDHYLKNDYITTLVLTEGEKGGDPINRVIEQENSFKILAPGSKNILFSFPDTQLYFHTHEIINKISSTIVDNIPDIVYIPSNHDFHQDHIVTYSSALAVFNHIKVRKIVCYETPSAMTNFSPNYFKFCDPEFFKVKLQALKCHKSQIEKSYFSEETICSIAKMRAAQGGYHENVAEAYEIIRLVEF